MLRRIQDWLRPLLGRGNNAGGSGEGGVPASRGYLQDREDERVGRMSDEDRAWEAASLQRDRERREREETP